jgi:hypothetical protein
LEPGFETTRHRETTIGRASGFLTVPAQAISGPGMDWDLVPSADREIWIRYIRGLGDWLLILAPFLHPRVKDLVRWTLEHDVAIPFGAEPQAGLAALDGFQWSLRLTSLVPDGLAMHSALARVGAPRSDIGALGALPAIQTSLDGVYIAALVVSAPPSARKHLLGPLQRVSLGAPRTSPWSSGSLPLDVRPGTRAVCLVHRQCANPLCHHARGWALHAPVLLIWRSGAASRPGPRLAGRRPRRRAPTGLLVQHS